MCDTFGIIKNSKAIFGKNSDRGPNEPQVLEFINGYKPKLNKLKTTYIEIDQVKEVYSILISRPIWLWGAEMGVNEFGVCIGNEAIFTKGKYNKIGLTGMDLVRLGLERSKTAKEAKDIIIELLKKYNQGGNCGYDHKFLYNNSFLIMDRKEIYILETNGKNYNISQEQKECISNCMILQGQNLKEDPLFRHFSGARKRNKLVHDKLTDDIEVLDAFNILRTHSDNKYNSRGSVSSVCMHAGGLVGDHTTASLVVELTKDINIYFTGSSLPCISLFKPFKFGDKIKYPICDNTLDSSYWYNQEIIRRKLIGKEIPDSYYKKRDVIEKKMLKEKISLEDVLLEEEKLNKVLTSNLPSTKINPYYKNYWKKKTKILLEENNND